MHYYPTSPCWYPVKGLRYIRVQNTKTSVSASDRDLLELDPCKAQSSPAKGLLLLRPVGIYHRQATQRPRRRIEYKCTNRLVGSKVSADDGDGQLDSCPKTTTNLVDVHYGQCHSPWQTPTPTRIRRVYTYSPLNPLNALNNI